MDANQIFDMVGSNMGTFIDVGVMISQILVLLAVLAYAWLLYRFDTLVMVDELAKNQRVIGYKTRAREFVDRKTKTPKMQFFGKMGFGGDIIEKPPVECIVPFRSKLTNKLYKFIKKDGLYYPVQNLVLGQRYILKQPIQSQDLPQEILEPAKNNNLTFINTKKEIKEIYSIEGSGLEISRDYDAEEAINNNLTAAAIKYRNKDQKNQIYLAYGLMIVTVVVSGVIMFFALNQFGSLSQAIATLKEPLKEGIAQGVASKLGP